VSGASRIAQIALGVRSRGLRTGLRDERGSALVELAFFVTFFATPLLLGTADMGFLVYDSIEITNAAHAAAAYGMQSATLAANNAGMTTAAQTEAADFGTAVTVSPTTYYACATAVGGTQYTGSNAQSNATAACTGTSNHALQFVQVNTSASVTPPIRFPGLPASFTVRGTSVMEVEQ
jgi:Flp pilus assembly protein TadG